MTTPLLQVQNVTRHYAMGGLFGRGHRAVDDVSFDVGATRPEILALIGESGSGKTTMARLILGTVALSSGSIRFKGVDMATQRGRREWLAFMH
jgi:peptide/nickel transport system ATP-binding protein